MSICKKYRYNTQEIRFQLENTYQSLADQKKMPAILHEKYEKYRFKTGPCYALKPWSAAKNLLLCNNKKTKTITLFATQNTPKEHAYAYRFSTNPQNLPLLSVDILIHKRNAWITAMQQISDERIFISTIPVYALIMNTSASSMLRHIMTHMKIPLTADNNP